jgi:hypothetical protein
MQIELAESDAQQPVQRCASLHPAPQLLAPLQHTTYLAKYAVSVESRGS